MINWNAIPASYNEAWTYLEMLGKLVSVVNKHEEDIEGLQTEVTNIWENFANYYTKEEADAHFISDDDLLNFYTKEEADARFALITDLVPIQQQINELKTSAALGGSAELILVPSGNIELSVWGGDKGRIDVTLGKYEALSEQPDDWTTSYTSYYYIDSGTGKYTQIPEQTLPPQFIPNTYYNYIPKNYDAILLSITYTLTKSPSVAYTKTLTVLLNKSAYAYDFVVYGVDEDTAAILGSEITTHAHNNGDIYTLVKLLDNTDRITSAVVTAVAFTEAGSMTPEAKAALYALADVDEDGKVTAADATIILQFSSNVLADNYANTDAGFAEFMQEFHPDIYAAHVGAWKMPDVDGSGEVTIIDAQMVLSYYTNIVVAGRYEDNPETFYLWMNGYIH